MGQNNFSGVSQYYFFKCFTSFLKNNNDKKTLANFNVWLSNLNIKSVHVASMKKHSIVLLKFKQGP